MLLLLLQLAQDPTLMLNASVDKARLTVGEEVTLTVVAGGVTADQVEVNLPDFAGFTVVARTERSDVTLGVARSRVVTLELRMRAMKAGNYAFGPIRARQGKSSGEIDGPDVEVTESAAAGMLALNPRVRDLVSRAPPPRTAGRVALSVELARDTVLVGEQVDLLTAAWFPRDLRAQLRRQPVLQPPVLDGVWSFPQASPPGIAASKRVGEKWYDLFVAHQVVFPLAAGEVRVPSASLRYAVPVATQFFSQEERFNVLSEPRRLVVLPLPLAGQPAGFSGATGRDLTLDRTVTPTAGRAGEALTVAVSVRGEGNVALWPAPEIAWPSGVRAYAEGSTEEMRSVAGRLTGTKHFKFVVVPSESGVLALPAVRYPYFDFGRRAYVTATLSALGVAVGPAREASTARALPPALLTAHGPPLAERIVRLLPPWGWAGIAVLAPLVVLGARWRRRHRVPVVPARRKSDDPDLSLDRALTSLVGRADIATAERLVPALRAVGLTEAEAQDIAELRDGLQRHRYGPPAAGSPPGGASLESALNLLRAVSTARPLRTLLLLLTMAGSLAAQDAPPESLYAAGALRRAADGFEAALATTPRDPALWYNLGASRYRLGEDGAAAAAWLTALRLAPRDATVRRALLLTPPPDQVSAGRRSVPPLSAAEMAVLALAAWVAAWALIGHRVATNAPAQSNPSRPAAAKPPSRVSRGIPVLLLLAVLASGGALLTWWWNRRPLGLVATDVPIRVAPHGRAKENRVLAAGTAVLVERQLPGWVLVRATGDERGWLPEDAVAAVGR